jgi:hypothetical protein
MLHCTIDRNRMPASAKLLAWIVSQGGHQFTAAFVAALAPRRRPATRRCASMEEARRWVEQEAEALGGVPIAWTDQEPGIAKAA